METVRHDRLPLAARTTFTAPQTAGTPAVAVGAGQCHRDRGRDRRSRRDAAEKIRASKCFDNATSCSSENAVVVVGAVYDAFIAAMAAARAAPIVPMTRPGSSPKALARRSCLNRAVIAQDADKMIAALGLDLPQRHRIHRRPHLRHRPGSPPVGRETLSRVLALYRAPDFEHGGAAPPTPDPAPPGRRPFRGPAFHRPESSPFRPWPNRDPHQPRDREPSPHLRHRRILRPTACPSPSPWAAAPGAAIPPVNDNVNYRHFLQIHEDRARDPGPSSRRLG